MKIKRFEDIDAWKEARILTRFVYTLTKKQSFSRDFGLAQQIQRASISVMNNIAEGFDSYSKLEFIKFLSYARRSSSEIQCDLYLALDLNYIDKKEFIECYELSEKVRRMTTAFMNYLRNC